MANNAILAPFKKYRKNKVTDAFFRFYSKFLVSCETLGLALIPAISLDSITVGSFG